MLRDTSYDIYVKQKGARFLPVTCVLKSGVTYSGTIVAFNFGDPDAGESYIIKWHIAPLEEAMLCGRGLMGQTTGLIVYHHHLSHVLFGDGTHIQIS